ncbi:hypothetical protein BJX61DRAFT_357078 [Aspergillus egyptiacus]|nr:hypothetical protein BJX61DRAFT_357078 [Aspergillus egyptiacus]
MSLDTTPAQPSVSERRGQQRLAPLQTNFSRPTSQIINNAPPRPQRPRPSDFEDANAERVPLQPAPVKRQSSRSSLRNIFIREKSGRKSTHDPRLSGIEEAQDSVKQSLAETAAPISPIACATSRAAASAPTPATPPQLTDMPHTKLQQNSKSKTLEDEPPAEDVAWKPPPLFKAYPQGLKHTTLPAPTLSSDSIMRLHATFKAKGANLHDDDSQSGQQANEEPSEDLAPRRKKLEKENQKYLRALSDNIENSEWTRKVFVLATSGYILQYPGDGKHDRLPEKMLLLGPKSVAFASDAIPGKHWVLQVSQGSEEGSSTNTAEGHRPLFSRFAFHRSYARRLAQNMLLVFTDPDEMSSWLLAVRAQIEARGGKKYVSEKVYDEGMESQLRTRPSMRQMVKKDPNRFSAVYLQPRQSMVFEEKDPRIGDKSRRSSYASVNRRSIVMQPAPDSRSGSISTSQTELASNAEEPARYYSAVGAPPLPDGSIISETSSSVTGPSSPTFSSPRKRHSMFLQHATNSESPDTPQSRSAVSDPHVRSASPPAPNFSVPVFSKRFAARQGVPLVPHLPPLRGDQHRDDISIEAVSMLSSPPQSPGREFFSGCGDMHEQRQPVDRRDLATKQLRPSISEDALGNSSRDQAQSRIRYSHLPEKITMSAGPSGSPRPVPINDLKPSRPTTASHAVKSFTDIGNTSNRRERSSVVPQSTRPSSLVMSRRKSLSGLTLGPPAAPPPTCPLPKIPSAFIEPSPQSGWPEHSLAMTPVKDAEKAPAAVMPTTATQSQFPRTVRSVTARQVHPNA